MSMHNHAGRVIPLCRGYDCQEDADMVVAGRDDRDAEPFCFPCGNAVLYNEGGIEYPVEEFYTVVDGRSRVTQYDPHDRPEFSIYDPDHANGSYINADNHEAPGSSVHPHNWN